MRRRPTPRSSPGPAPTPPSPPTWPLPNLFSTTTPALRFSRTEIGTHPQEILENNVDTTHLYPLHAFPDSAVLD
ncbi:hypothetical protein ACFXAZ_15810 [Streptomyces sp. NPDC059477]|uniref:hypothetical protein n=1 Tax=Streptomyces sp. NPDC059477 TaxID=3346847 RepID=UPI0036CCC485